MYNILLGNFAILYILINEEYPFSLNDVQYSECNELYWVNERSEWIVKTKWMNETEGWVSNPFSWTIVRLNGWVNEVNE